MYVPNSLRAVLINELLEGILGNKERTFLKVAEVSSVMLLAAPCSRNRIDSIA